MLLGCAELKGPRGEQGPPGPVSADAQGTAYRPSAWMFCIRAVDVVLDDGISETLLRYSFTIFSNRDVEVSCEAAAGAQAGSGNHYRPSTTLGASNAACSAGIDLPPLSPPGGNSGYWDFKTNETGPSARYVDDVGHPLHGLVVRFAENDCAVMLADDAGTWRPSSLGEAFN